MAFYYDSDSDHEHDLGALPIILEPDNESNTSQSRKPTFGYANSRYNDAPRYDGSSYKGDSDEEYLEDEHEAGEEGLQLNASTYDDQSVLSQSRYGDSNGEQLSQRSYDDMRSHASRENDDTMKEVQMPESQMPVHMPLQVPTHPIASMQDAFGESMMEASGASTPSEKKQNLGSAAARRKHLLDQEIDEETHAARWRQKPGQQYHELWKLMSQISFGIYLLLNGIAKDEDQVMNILQGHVDEVDSFLESTLEDFDLAQDDIEERLKFLKLPLENIVIFDAMLEDRNFRVQIVSGNGRIEHVITRTAKAMNDALKDVAQGLDACKEFTIYLAKMQDEPLWKAERPDMYKVFEAMKGNVEGWYKAYVSLQTKGNNLGVALVQLGTIVAEMDRRAGDISRKSRFSGSLSPTSPPALSPRQSRQMRQSMLKTLPNDPTPITPAIRAALPAFGMVDDRERSPEAEPISSTQSSSSPSELSAVPETAPEPEFMLKPHTYSPVPSPKPPSARIAAPSPTIPISPKSSPPQVKKRSSLRNRFSLKRKETPSEITLKAPPTLQPAPHLRGEIPRQSVRSSSGPNPRDLNTPPSRGLDSAYCSDFEKHSPPTDTSFTSPRIPPRDPGRTASPNGRVASPNLNRTASPHTTRTASPGPGRATPPMLSRDYLPSPRSDQQFFRPVNASPNSPLQRPWTAAPTNIMHMHSNSSSSNLRFGQVPPPSMLGNRRGAPSAMGMSVMTDASGVSEGGRKLKKKRSAFGWLKKAFSLSEEEREAFERRRRMGDEGWEGRGEQRWLDGKRIR